jgi:hypothetical protein
MIEEDYLGEVGALRLSDVGRPTEQLNPALNK